MCLASQYPKVANLLYVNIHPIRIVTIHNTSTTAYKITVKCCWNDILGGGHALSSPKELQLKVCLKLGVTRKFHDQ